MLLERLPYMLLIAKSRKSSSSAIAIKDIEKVVTFHGIGGPSEEDADEGEDGVVGEEWATDKPGDGRSPKKKGMVIRGRGQATALPRIQEVKLVLSDDDIEDD
jgi:cell cycle checkpoint protein